MITNPFYSNNEDFVLDGKRYITQIGPLNEVSSTGTWHQTTSGELQFLEAIGSNLFRYKEGEQNDPPLSSLNDIARYITNRTQQSAQLPGFLPLLNAPDVLYLALYPWHFTLTDSDAAPEIALEALYDGLALNGSDTAGRRMAQYIFFIGMSSYAARQFVRYCISHMPAKAAGMICAHGLTHKGFWETRHREVLIEAWRYQLRHPDQAYRSQERNWDTGPPRCLIERAVALEDRESLLAATGLTEEDVSFAIDLADLMPEENFATRSEVLLSELATRSNLQIQRKQSVDTEHLDRLID